MTNSEELLVAFYRARNEIVDNENTKVGVTQNEISVATGSAAEYLDGPDERINNFVEDLQSFFEKGWAVPAGSHDNEGNVYMIRLTSRGCQHAKNLIDS
jgi:hypothetical protein